MLSAYPMTTEHAASSLQMTRPDQPIRYLTTPQIRSPQADTHTRRPLLKLPNRSTEAAPQTEQPRSAHRLLIRNRSWTAHTCLGLDGAAVEGAVG